MFIIGYLKLALQRRTTSFLVCSYSYIGLEENAGMASCQNSFSVDQSTCRPTG
jgi:hypothetical protein